MDISKIKVNNVEYNIKEATKVTWDANSNMNDFKTPGVYEIYGERTVKTDNLPIMNEGGGNSIAARLTVVASTLQPANNEICVTQFLQLSNRVGGEGTTYVRTYNENNNGMNGWSPWQKQMGMVETLVNSNYATVGQEIFSGPAKKIGNGLNGMIDNGMYSGIYIDNLGASITGIEYCELSAQPTFVETFVLIVINDYAASGKLNLPRHITQLKYAVDAITGQSTVKKRVGTGSETISCGDWEDIGSGGVQEVDITDAVNAEGLTTLMSKSLIKKGVTYVVKCRLNSIPSLEPYGGQKIKEFLLNKADSYSHDTDVTFKIITFTNNELFIDCFILYPKGLYYKFSINEISAVTYKVRVSSDMTVL